MAKTNKDVFLARLIRERLVLRLRPLRVGAREHPVPVPLRDQGSLEVDLAKRADVTHRLGKLERARDVVARRFVVALPPVTAGAPGEDVRSQQIRRER